VDTNSGVGTGTRIGNLFFDTSQDALRRLFESTHAGEYIITGTNHGDTVNITTSLLYFTPRLTFFGGHGDDVINIENTSRSPSALAPVIELGYSGGNDRVVNGESVKRLIIWGGNY
jgi:hypothetical protein